MAVVVAGNACGGDPAFAVESDTTTETGADAPSPTVGRPRCVVHGEWDLASLTEPSPIEIRGEDVIREALGRRSAAVTWSLEGPVTLHVSNAADHPTTLTSELQYDAGAVRYVDREVVVPTDVDIVQLTWPICEDTVEVEVSLHLYTDDGALDERWTATLEKVGRSDTGLGSPSFVGMSVPLQSIHAEIVEPTGASVASNLGVRLDYPEGGFAGLLLMSGELPSGSAWDMIVAQW